MNAIDLLVEKAADVNQAWWNLFQAPQGSKEEEEAETAYLVVKDGFDTLCEAWARLKQTNTEDIRQWAMQEAHRRIKAGLL